MAVLKRRKELDAQRLPQFASVFTLLNGLEEAEMRKANHVLHVIRLRSERCEQRRRSARGLGRSAAAAAER